MKAIILAGGRATRLPYSAKDKPKALVEVGGKPILQHQIELLQKHGFFDIRLALGYKSDQIIKYVRDYVRGWTPHIEYVVEPEPLDTGGAIKFASRGLSEPFMVLNGDILSDMDFGAFFEKFKKRPESNIIAVFHTDNAMSYGIIKKEEGRVAEFLEKPFDSDQVGHRKKRGGYINAGFYILSPDCVGMVSKKKFSIERETFPKIASLGELAFYIHKGFWTDAGTEKRLSEAKEFFNKL